MSAGLTASSRRWLAFRLWFGEVGLWNLLCILGIMEKLNKWRIYT